MANMIKVTMTINKPVETVWKEFMNPDNLQHWLTGFVSIEHISGNIGQPGSVSKLTTMERGKSVEIIEKVLTVIPNQQYAFEMEHDSFQGKIDVRLVSFGSRTEFIQTAEFSPKGFMMKLMMPMLKGIMKKQTANELVKLKNFIEAKP